MNISHRVLVMDVPDLTAASTFWSRLLGGSVDSEDDWHTISLDGLPQIAFQLVPDYRAPDWPDGERQQMHLDLFVKDIRAAHDEALALGARVLQGADVDARSGYVVFADPAGHPFCLCWE